MAAPTVPQMFLTRRRMSSTLSEPGVLLIPFVVIRHNNKVSHCSAFLGPTIEVDSDIIIGMRITNDCFEIYFCASVIYNLCTPICLSLERVPL
jgi:hypothetical protein